MSHGRSERLRQLSADALKLPASERSAFLRQSCGADWASIEEVEHLLSQTAGSVQETAVCVRLKGRYVLQRELGRGGFGAAYLATDDQLLSRRVVVKILHRAPPGSWERRKFRDEIEALARLNHPGIVSVLDSGETEEGQPFLVMEYIDGVSLRSLLPPRGFALDRAAEIVRQAGAALQAAHRHGVCHRDLKPENILIQTLTDGELRVKLIDFGIAKVERAEAQADSGNHIAGTFAYMAPEGLAGRPSPSSDIYSLAVVAYEMLTGRTPFPAETAVELHEMQRAGVQARPRSLRPGIPEEAERCLLKALSFGESDRYESVMDFAQDMAQALRSANLRDGTARIDRDPHIGRMVSKMCNRRTQEDEFRAFLTRGGVRCPGPALLCIVHGDEGECHESLIERLAYSAELLASRRRDDEGPSVKIVKIPWQYEGPVEVRLGRLAAWLVERISTGDVPRIEDTSPAALGELLTSNSAGFVFVQHDIRAARWNDQIKSLIQAYRGYLAEIPLAPAVPQVVVCLNVIYPSASRIERSWLRLRPGALARKLMKKRIARDLADIAGPGTAGPGAICDCLLLDELKPISRDDVLEWFSLHNILETEEQRLKAAGRIFTRTGSLAAKRMAEIETELRNVQNMFLLERGLI